MLEFDADPTVDDLMASTAQHIAKNGVIGAMAVALVPVPAFDMAAVMAINLKMLHALGEHYGVPFSENVAKSTVLSLASGVAPVACIMGLSSVLKLIPGIGTVAGTAGTSVLAGAFTYAVGKVFIQHFESGGTFVDFDPASVRDVFRRAVDEGKSMAGAAGEGRARTTTEPSNAEASGQSGE